MQDRLVRDHVAAHLVKALNYVQRAHDMPSRSHPGSLGASVDRSKWKIRDDGVKCVLPFRQAVEWTLESRHAIARERCRHQESNPGPTDYRSEERREGKEGVSKGKSRWWRQH